MFFIGYGDKQFGYRFWDDQNRKIIRSRNVVFHEIILYKDKSGGSTNTTDIALKNPNLVNLNIPDFTPQDQSVDMKVPIVPQNEAEPSTPPTVLNRSTRSIKVPDRYSLSLDYILLTDSDKLESYKEALEDKNSSKWELAMKDEMDSLLGNQTWIWLNFSKVRSLCITSGYTR